MKRTRMVFAPSGTVRAVFRRTWPRRRGSMTGAPDPHHDPAASTSARAHEPARYPTNHVLGIVDTLEQARALVSALENGGFLESEIEYRTGTQEADDLHASPGRTGLAGLLIRAAERIGAADEELETKHRYEQAMRDNRYVVAVATPTDERKERASQLFRAHGANTITSFGKHTIEYIVPPGKR